MKKSILLSVFVLMGCSTTVPVVAKFPSAPASLVERCPPLKKLEGEQVSIVDLHTKVVENYTQYHECAIKVDEWNNWYTKQKKIFEDLK